jgi:hypothetical protein
MGRTVAERGEHLEIGTDQEHLYREFFFLSLTIADMIQVGKRSPVEAFAQALGTWKELLQAATKMTDEQQLGLLGELWALRRMVVQNADRALDAWTGPRGEPHDFRTGKTEFEVKSTRSTSRTHVIHGLHQLVPSRGCRLYILSLQWEPAGASDGWSLPTMVAEVRDLLAASPSGASLFVRLLRDQLMYRDEDAPLYEERLRLRTAPRLIEVTAQLPSLTPPLISEAFGANAPRISDVTYRLNVEGLGLDETEKRFRQLLP